MTTTNLVTYEVANHIGIITVQRPRAHNALNWAAQAQFAAAVDEAAGDSQLRALIITGAGSQAFVSGGDLKELVDYPTAEDALRLAQIMGQALNMLTRLPVPVIAAINGDAFGGGCEIITACDIRLAVAHANLSFVQIKMGLTPGWGGSARLVHLVGQSQAMRLLLRGSRMTATQALAIGLVHHVVPSDVLSEAIHWAQEFVALPRQALAANKFLVHAATQRPLAEVEAYETHLFAELWPQADHLEAVQAFLEKRDARFNQEAAG